MTAVSALISTYATELATNLATSLESLYCQTLPPSQVVLVLDGPVGQDQEDVIKGFASDARVPQLTVVRLLNNVGLAAAMNAGLEHCSGDFVMRMDSDDISLPDRLELQISYASLHPDIDLISSWSEEFFEDGACPQMKVSPVSHDAVARAMRWRNVLVHPTILVRTSKLRQVGGYRSKYGRLEDYDLFVRLILAGAQFHVLPKVLVRVRSSTSQKVRRGGFRYCLDEIRFRTECFRVGFLSMWQFIMSASMYTVFRLISPSIRRQLYSLARS
jgi:glycosyltransferase involved in cell wall biosynthesis